MFAKSILRLVTQPLVVATGAAVLVAEIVNTKQDREAAILGGFFVVGILPNLLKQLWSYFRKGAERESVEQIFAYDFEGGDSRGEFNSKINRHNRNQQTHIERWYVFWFGLLAVVYGSQLFAHEGWMVIAMAYAVYHGINLLVIKYFSPINSRIGEVVFWSTLLININPQLAFTYLLLLPLIWWHPGERRLDFVALNWSIGIGLFSALLTWIS